MDTQEIKKHKRNLVRSPSYPSIDLETAIDLSRTIKTKEGGGNHFIPYQVVVGHWGYKPGSGPGALKLAALKKYGLIEDKGISGKREIKLTELAMRILFYEEGDENHNEYFRALQEAALSPSIHKELWNKWPDSIPSDQTIRTYLVLHRASGRFAESSVDNFIKQFRSTISFANLEKDDSMFEHEKDKTTLQKEKTMPNTQTDLTKSIDKQNLLDIPIPFKEATGRVIIPYPLSAEDWKKLDAILTAYKPEEKKEQ